MAQLNSHDTTPMWSHCMSVTHWHDFKIPMTRQYQQVSAKTNKYVVHTHCYTIPIFPCTNATKLMVHILSLASQPELHVLERRTCNSLLDMERSLDVGWKMWCIIKNSNSRKSNSLLFRFSWMYTMYTSEYWVDLQPPNQPYPIRTWDDITSQLVRIDPSREFLWQYRNGRNEKRRPYDNQNHTSYIGLSPLPVTQVANEGLGWDPRS